MRSFLTLIFLFPTLLVCAQTQTLLVVQQHSDSLLFYSINDSKKIGGVVVGHMPHEIACDQATQRCFVTNFGVEDYDTRIGIPGRSITVVDPFRQQILHTIQTGFGAIGNMPHGVKVRPGSHRELFVNIERGDSMLIYDITTYKEIRRFAVPAGTHNFIFSQAGNRLWIMAGANGVYEINPQNGKIKAHQIFQTPIRGLSFLADDILASGNNELYLLSKKKLAVHKHFQNLGVGQILYSAVTQDQRFILCPAAFDSTVLVVNAKNGTIVKRIQTDKTPINIQVNERYAFVSHALAMHISQIDLHTFIVTKRIDVADANGLLIVKQSPTDVFKPLVNQTKLRIGKIK